jgi:hypothetical protein
MSDQEAGSCIIEQNDNSAMTSEDRPMELSAEESTKEKKSKNGFVSRLQEYETLFKNRLVNA